MRPGTASLVIGLAAATVTSCASKGAQEAGGAVPVASAGAIRADVGVATLDDLATQTENLFTKYQYELFRKTPPPDVLYESTWRDRELTADERAAGIAEARSRLLVRARQRNFTGGTGDTWSVELSVESLVRRDGDAEFRAAPPTDQLKRAAREISEEMKLKLREGIRRGP